jgi:hypothetical protein
MRVDMIDDAQSTAGLSWRGQTRSKAPANQGEGFAMKGRQKPSKASKSRESVPSTRKTAPAGAFRRAELRGRQAVFAVTDGKKVAALPHSPAS